MWHALIQLLRPHQWLKNSFVFVGIIFSHRWQDSFLLKQVSITALAFCCIASALYIINDICDCESDRKHPIKKFRPLAAKKISLTFAITLCVICATVGLLLGSIVSTIVVQILLGYIILNIAYSIYFKQWVILDVFIIATGFLLRILAGTIGVEISPSGWLLLCSLGLTLFLGFNKRRAEYQLLAHSAIDMPKVIAAYTPAFVDKLITITATTAILSYTFYCLQQDTLLYSNQHRFIYTVPLVMYGLFRYLYLLEKNLHTGLDIAADLLHDFQLINVIVVWLIVIVGLGI